MKILLTGGCGFIGGNVKEYLQSKGVDTINYDLKQGLNLLDTLALERHIIKADMVLHIAAQANLNEMTDLDGARKGVEFNVYGTHNVCFLCAKHKKKLIYASTVCVYGNMKGKSIADGAVNPSELYAYSKYAGEQLVKGYSSNFGLEYIILRFATTYGPGMRDVLGTSIFIRQAKDSKDITVHGNGKQTRTLTHVRDIVYGCFNAITMFDKCKNNTFNISQSERVSALKMAKDIKKITNSKSRIVFVEQRQNQTFDEDICLKKTAKLLKWKPKISWLVGIKDTIDNLE
jgi:nucleoside-diphosphate-sugar epimerase